MIRKLSIVALITAFAVLAACGGSQSYTQKAQKSLSVTYETLQIAEKAFVSWDSAHQQQIVAEAKTQQEAEEGLNKYREQRQPVISAFAVAYSSIAAALSIMPLVEKGLKGESDLMALLGDAVRAALDVKSASDAIQEAFKKK